MNFTKYVHSVQILNSDDEESTMSLDEMLLHNSDPNPEKFIVSDADEELIILIKFTKSTDVKSFKIYALPLDDAANIDEASPPKQIYIFKLSHLNHNFEDIKGLKPHKSLICSTKKLSKGQNVNLRKNISKPLAFAKVEYMAIFIESNQGDTDNTYFHGLSFKGESNGTNQPSSSVRSRAITLCYCREPVECPSPFKPKLTNDDVVVCHSCFQEIWKTTIGPAFFCTQKRQCCYFQTTSETYRVCGECQSVPTAHQNQYVAANDQFFIYKKAEASLTRMR